jgi:hypothetical protein
VALAWCLAMLLLYRDTAVAMVGIWSRSDTFAHAFLVPPISAVADLAPPRGGSALRPSPSPGCWCRWRWLCVGWLLGDLVGRQRRDAVCAGGLLVLSVPLVLGCAVTRALLFPLAFLFFCVPFGEFLMPC